jgi:O-methyltransferase
MDRMKDFIRPLAIQVASSHRLQRAAHRTAYFGRFHDWTLRHPCSAAATRLELYERVLKERIGERPVWYLEFGVYKGTTTAWWAQQSSHKDSLFVGFDSFEGLPESWGAMAAGTFSTNGAIPDIRDERVRFEKGWFSTTVPRFLAREEAGERVMVAHLDADLYSSTLLVLVHLAPHLRPGSILIFDEFADYEDEFRALHDAQQAYPFRYRAIGHTPGWTQVALEITADS